MTNANTVTPTARPPATPRPAYVVTNRSTLDKVVWATVTLVVVFVLGFLGGQAHQQAIYDKAVEDAKQKLKQQGPAQGAPAKLTVSWWYNGKEMPDLEQDPNCTLYRDPCPLDPPAKPTTQPPHCTKRTDGDWDCGGYRDAVET